MTSVNDNSCRVLQPQVESRLRTVKSTSYVISERPVGFYLSIREGAKRNVFARDPIFGGSCVPKPLPLKDSNTTGVPQAARKIKRAKIRGQ